MSTWIAWFRGINVGGRHRVPMKTLTSLLEAIGCESVRTYIQSGNAVFDHPEKVPDRLATRIAESVEAAQGFQPQVLILSVAGLREAVADNPFPEAEQDPSKLHLGFLPGTPRDPDLARLERLRTPGERFELRRQVFYLHAPDGIGRSRLANALEKALGMHCTLRNWRTVTRVLDMAANPEA